MPTTHHYAVSGRVQGVGFRAATCDKARQLGLAGWVCNRRDGCVEVAAAGDDGTLAEFAEWLQHGPSMARVDDVTCDATATDNTLPASFEIR